MLYEVITANLPGVKEIRSVSKFGLSVVTVVFEDNIGTYLPRQLIAEKIKNAEEKIPTRITSYNVCYTKLLRFQVCLIQVTCQKTLNELLHQPLLLQLADNQVL